MRSLVVLFALAACAGKVPETKFYSFAEPSGRVTNGNGASVAIEPLATDSAYDDERIVYRVTPYRLDYYNYHRWSAAPGMLIANYLERALEKSGKFGAVTRETNPDALVTLGGRVVAIEEVDRSKTQWVGRLVLELTLTDNESGELLWAEQFEEIEPLPMQSPEGLARAISAALERIANRTVPQVAVLADQVARGRGTAKPTASRAARRSR